MPTARIELAFSPCKGDVLTDILSRLLDDLIWKRIYHILILIHLEVY